MNYRIASKGFTNLLAKRFLGPFWIRRQWLKKTQWLDKNQLELIQLILLKKIISHSYRTVPFYKKLMDENSIKPERIKTIDDIKLFPILTKKDVLKAGNSIYSTKYPKLLLRTAYTGGTTGTPMKIQRDLFSIGNEHAFVRRQWDWAGLGLRDKCAYLTGRLIVKPDQKDGLLYAYEPFMRELILSTYHLSAETARDYAEVIKSYKIKTLVGYPSAVHLLAIACLNAGIEINLNSVLTTSETLSHSMLKVIAEVFRCKIFDFYGAAERVCYIHMCEQGTYHVIPEYGLTELIPMDNSAKNRCRVISTGFWNKAMPVIRYDTGDIAIKSERPCPCGRQFQSISSIAGRDGDIIRTTSGRQFGVTLMVHFLYIGCMDSHILEAQVIQDALDHVTIEYVPDKDFCRNDLGVFEKIITRHLPSELKITLKKVERVRRTLSGKVKPVISHIT